MIKYRIVKHTKIYNSGQKHIYYVIEKFHKILMFSWWKPLSLYMSSNSEYEWNKLEPYYDCISFRHKYNAQRFITELTQCDKDNNNIIPIVGNNNWEDDDFIRWVEKCEHNTYKSILHNKSYITALSSYISNKEAEFNNTLKSHYIEIC